MRLIAFGMICILLSSVFVSAAGVATRSSSGDCDDLSSLQGRIQCRLELGQETTGLPESCKVLVDTSECVAMYDAVQGCYEKTGTVRDQCFRRIAGFVSGTVAGEARESNGRAHLQWYLFFLLYSLQERAEAAYEEGTVSGQDAATLIRMTIEIKQSVLLGESSAQIRADVEELKTLWGQIMT